MLQHATTDITGVTSFYMEIGQNVDTRFQILVYSPQFLTTLLYIEHIHIIMFRMKMSTYFVIIFMLKKHDSLGEMSKMCILGRSSTFDPL